VISITGKSARIRGLCLGFPGAVSRVPGGKLWDSWGWPTGSSTVLGEIVRRPGEPELPGVVPALDIKRQVVCFGRARLRQVPPKLLGNLHHLGESVGCMSGHASLCSLDKICCVWWDNRVCLFSLLFYFPILTWHLVLFVYLFDTGCLSITCGASP
jgi:hypothetical protein